MTDRSVSDILEHWRALERQRDEEMSAEERIELDQAIAAVVDEYRTATASTEPLNGPLGTLTT